MAPASRLRRSASSPGRGLRFCLESDLLFHQLSRRSNVLALLPLRRISEVIPAFRGKRLEAGDHVRVLRGEVVGFTDVAFKVEQRYSDLALRVFPWLAIAAGRVGMIVIVRQVQLPFAAPHGL